MQFGVGQQSGKVAKVHGRLALVGEYLDGIFSDRAVTCTVADEWYELVVTTSEEAAGAHDAIIDNRRLIPAILESVRSRLPSLPACSVRTIRAMKSGSGLGSSAAFSVGVVAGASAIGGIELDKAAIAEIAVEAERRFGITGGRMDQYSAAFGGTNAFRFSELGPTEVIPLSMPSDMMFVIADSGVRRPSGKIIDGVLERAATGAIDVDAFVRHGNRIADEMIEALGERETDLARIGDLVNQSHIGLRDFLHVSSPVLDRLVSAARNAGAYGAKISGAGVGGCIIALCDQRSVIGVTAALKREGAAIQATTVEHSGVVVSESESGTR
jgi:mevalonate kinase